MTKSSLFLPLFLLSFTLCSAQEKKTQHSKNEETFTTVDQMPRFYSPKCEKETTDPERKRCAEKAMLLYLYKHLTIKKEDQNKSFPSFAAVQFTITKTGAITNPKIIKGEGPLGDAILKVINQMPNWIPGKQDGDNVNVRFSIPIRIRLSY